MHDKHGDTKGGEWHRLYRIWVAMRQRCNDPNRDGFAGYGGRGIKVCPEWDSSYPAFKAWALANGYASHLTIDRVDVNGNYEPGNCRWLTVKEQLSNTRRSKLVTVNGVTRNVLEWSRVTGIVWSTLYKRYRKGVRGVEFIAPPKQARKGASL
jgi:hypothetical protein